MVPAKEERDGRLAKLRASGSDVFELTHKAEAVHREWQQIAAEFGSEVSVSAAECHALGCAIHVAYATTTSIEPFTEEIVRSDVFRTWDGGKIQSGTIATSGDGAEVTWILLSPDPKASSDEDVEAK
jgi:hypothetical protein